MEFYEFFEKLVSFIPSGFEQLRAVCEAVLPWLFGAFTLATSFFGHFVHKLWNVFMFFSLGFIVPLFVFFVIVKPTGSFFWVLVGISVAIGFFCAIYSHHLHKTKLFITTFLMVYIAVSGYVLAVGKLGAVLIGLTAGTVAALFALKYKYISVIVTTSFSGSMMFWDMIESEFLINRSLCLILTLVLGALGLACQCYIERNELKESYTNAKDKIEKIGKNNK